jgi:outer membrane protein OmpA-like peptidoglycan-associated protein
MKKTIHIKSKLLNMPLPETMSLKSILITLLVTLGLITSMTAQTQETFTKPSWWFGVATGTNLNFHRGSTQQLNDDLRAPAAFHNGFDGGLYVAPSIEYYRPNTRLGMMLQFGYDSRQAVFDEVLTPCDCPMGLSSKLTYLTIEPSLRFAPFKSDFYMYAGPRLAFNYDKSFEYQLGINPAYPDQFESPAVKGDFSEVEKTIISMQIGMGYDIPFSSQNRRTQFVVSPFVAFHPYFGQNPRSFETWNITTLRAGAVIKFGVGKKASALNEENTLAVLARPKVDFIVNSPRNIPAERTVNETFPVINYVFFDLGSTEIPNRYVTLNKNQVKDFKEDQVDLFTPSNLSGRSDRQMIVYYNILNILGDRMVKNPGSSVKLVGSSEKGPADGREMAESVKTYLVNIFEINASRITTEGRNKPAIPSEKPGATNELILLREGDRRVSIESNSPALLMEFQSGPFAPLKPIKIVNIQEAPVDSYVTFHNEGSNEAFRSWRLEIEDKDGRVQHFGPYTQEKVAIPGKAILGTNPKGDYNVKMIGTTAEGASEVKETKVSMVLWTPSKSEEVMRFSVPYNFDESSSIAMYEKYLTEVVAPKIPENGKVIIHGYTDIIGETAYNQSLSERRANDVKAILQKALTRAGRTDVTFEVNGYGEDTHTSPFDNKRPEERFYNRTVIIDILPKK